MMKRIKKILKFKLWSFFKDYCREKHELKYLFWECTLSCNLFCKHCGSSAGKNIFENELSTEQIKKSLKNIADDFNAKEVVIAVTGGEPLMRSDIFDVMGFASSLGFPWGMVTNGTLIDKDMIRKMEESQMESVAVSIDGNEKTHDEFRNVKGSYIKAIGAIKLLLKSKKIRLVEVITSVHSENINQLEEMYEKFLSIGIRHWRLMNVESIGRAIENKEILLQKYQINKLLLFIKNKRQEKKMNISYGCTGFLGYDFEGDVRERYFFCCSGINIGSILHNGDIYVCPDVPRRKDLIQGNVRKDRFSDVWNNKFQFFRDKNRTKCNECIVCKHWEQCLGGALHSWDFNKKVPKICYIKKD